MLSTSRNLYNGLKVESLIKKVSFDKGLIRFAVYTAVDGSEMNCLEQAAVPPSEVYFAHLLDVDIDTLREKYPNLTVESGTLLSVKVTALAEHVSQTVMQGGSISKSLDSLLVGKDKKVNTVEACIKEDLLTWAKENVAALGSNLLFPQKYRNCSTPANLVYFLFSKEFNFVKHSNHLKVAQAVKIELERVQELPPSIDFLIFDVDTGIGDDTLSRIRSAKLTPIHDPEIYSEVISVSATEVKEQFLCLKDKVDIILSDVKQVDSKESKYLPSDRYLLDIYKACNEDLSEHIECSFLNAHLHRNSESLIEEINNYLSTLLHPYYKTISIEQKKADLKVFLLTAREMIDRCLTYEYEPQISKNEVFHFATLMCRINDILKVLDEVKNEEEFYERLDNILKKYDRESTPNRVNCFQIDLVNLLKMHITLWSLKNTTFVHNVLNCYDFKDFSEQKEQVIKDWHMLRSTYVDPNINYYTEGSFLPTANIYRRPPVACKWLDKGLGFYGERLNGRYILFNQF